MRLPLVLILLLSLTLGSPAFASERAARRKALELAGEGAEAYKLGRYLEALRKFDAAYRIYQATPILLNLSRTELKLGECDEAIQYAQGYALGRDPGATMEQRSTWLQHVKTECVEALVTSVPLGATIVIEGAASTPAITPWHGRLLAGRHTVTATAIGYEPAHADLDVIAGKSLELTLTLKPGGTEPAPAVVAPPAASPPEKAPVVAAPPIALAAPAPAPPPAAPPIQLQPPPPAMPIQAAAAPAAKPAPAGRTAGWVATAIGGAALVAAAALGVGVAVQKGSLESANQNRSGAQAAQQVVGINTQSTAAVIAAGAGGVIAVTGVALVIAF